MTHLKCGKTLCCRMATAIINKHSAYPALLLWLCWATSIDGEPGKQWYHHDMLMRWLHGLGIIWFLVSEIRSSAQCPGSMNWNWGLSRVGIPYCPRTRMEFLEVSFISLLLLSFLHAYRVQKQAKLNYGVRKWDGDYIWRCGEEWLGVFKRGSWTAGFLNCVGYIEMIGLREFIKLCTYEWYTFLYMCYFNKKYYILLNAIFVGNH